MPTFKSVSTLGAACAMTAVLAACTSNSPAAPSPAATTPAATTQPSTPAATPSASSSPAATPSVAGTPVAVAPVATSSGPGTPAPGCATREGSLPGSSITVCPDAAPVGGVVHVTVKGCAPGDMPAMAAAALAFLGPGSWLGTDGGGGANVPFYPQTGSAEATATFTIPVTYTGGNENEKGGHYPTLTVKPGTSYSFVTDPAGGCNVPFTVTAG